MRSKPVEMLLVEDNPADVWLIRDALSLGPLPKNVNVVTDGEEALRYLARFAPYRDAVRPDLIILDLNLPKLDGRYVLEKIKQDPSLHQIPVIVLSTSNSDSDVQSAYENHVNCYLTKPCDLDEYLDLVQFVEDYWLSTVALPI